MKGMIRNISFTHMCAFSISTYTILNGCPMNILKKVSTHKQMRIDTNSIYEKRSFHEILTHDRIKHICTYCTSRQENLEFNKYTFHSRGCTDMLTMK